MYCNSASGFYTFVSPYGNKEMRLGMLVPQIKILIVSLTS